MLENHWVGHPPCPRNIAKMYVELLKTFSLFVWILWRKDTLCQKISLNQTYRNVLQSQLRMRWLPLLTQSLVPDLAARWKMRKCTGQRQKCWVQTKMFIKDQHLQNIICKTYDWLLFHNDFIHFPCLFYNVETVSQMWHLRFWF